VLLDRAGRRRDRPGRRRDRADGDGRRPDLVNGAIVGLLLEDDQRKPAQAKPSRTVEAGGSPVVAVRRASGRCGGRELGASEASDRRVQARRSLRDRRGTCRGSGGDWRAQLRAGISRTILERCGAVRCWPDLALCEACSLRWRIRPREALCGWRGGR